MDFRKNLERFQWRMSQRLQGCYGTDSLSNFLVVCAIVVMIVGWFASNSILSWISFLLLCVAVWRAFSRNIGARAEECAKFDEYSAVPKRYMKLASLSWGHRKTKRYFLCPTCKQILSVPRGKGKLRVTCPKCKSVTMRKS